MKRQDGVLTPTAFPPNPAYGSGIFRRRIRLFQGDDAVLGLIDDTNHAMWARIRHDGVRVTGVEGQTVRAPNSNCPGAAAALEELVGLPLDLPRAQLFGEGRPYRNCTHMFDIAALAMTHATSRAVARTYDVVIPDETDAPVVAQVLRDGETLLRWHVSNGEILEFGADAPIPIMRGFTGWAVANLDDDMLAAALLLQRAYLVSGARKWIVDRQPNLPITAMPELFGACYAYQPDRLEAGVQSIGNVIDVSDGFTHANLQPIP